jgi:predicted membrane chloride channel (bestrophin family)
MAAFVVLATLTGATALGQAASIRYTNLPRPSLTRITHASMREHPLSYEEYMRQRSAGRDPLAEAVQGQSASMERGVVPPPPVKATPERTEAAFTPPAEFDFFQDVFKPTVESVVKTVVSPGAQQDSDESYMRVPWWEQGSTYSEDQRKDRRTVFMHDDWKRHRSSERFFRNIKTWPSSGINQALRKELTFVTSVSVFVVLANMLLYQYQDFGGVVHPGPLSFLDGPIKSLSLPALPFSMASPVLSLLLVFRTNTAYFRWNEARTLWGGLINNCRNIVRQTTTMFPNDAYHNALKKRLATETATFIKSLRNFLRGPEDDATLRKELYAYVNQGLMTSAQAEATMAAKNRPMFALAAMSATLRKANIDEMYISRMDSTISVLVDLTGANERIFKSPIPLVYTRLTARFLSVFLTLLPLAMWAALGESWNHWATIPATFILSVFLFGVEEVGIQIEEPFSILPLEAMCNGAIEAVQLEMLAAEQSQVFEAAGDAVAVA